MRRRLVPDLGRPSLAGVDLASATQLARWFDGERPVYLLEPDASLALVPATLALDLLSRAVAGARIGVVYIAPAQAPWEPDNFVAGGGYVLDGAWLGVHAGAVLLIPAGIAIADGRARLGRPTVIASLADVPRPGSDLDPATSASWQHMLLAAYAAIAARIVVHPVLVTDRRGQREHARGRTSVHRYHVLRVVERGTATLERGAPVHADRGRVGLGIRLGAPPAPPARHVVHEHAHRHWLRPATAERAGYVLDPDAPAHPRLVRCWVVHRQFERGAGELRARETVVRG